MGVFLVSWTRAVTADDSYDVSATVSGTAPTQPATIDIPVASASFSSTPINVSGTCPLDTYVKILRNNVSAGIALCDGTGHYSLSIGLVQGTNLLIARDYNFADLSGPDSPVTSVFYQPSTSTALASSTPPTPTTGAQQSSPLILKSNFEFKGYNVNDKASWDIEIEGGNPPYAISVEWGDGSHSLYSRSQSGEMKIDHVYKKTGAHKGSYVIKVSATDKDGSSGYLEFVTVISDSDSAGFMGLRNDGISGSPIAPIVSDDLGRAFKYIWPSYGVVALMLASFWLGEIREVHLLKLHPRKIRR